MSKYAIDNFAVKSATDGWLYSASPMSCWWSSRPGAFRLYPLLRKAETHIAYDIRQQAFKKLQDLSFSYYDKTAVAI